MIKFALFCGPDPTAGGFSGGQRAGLKNRHDEGSVLLRVRGAVPGAVEAIWDASRQLFRHVGSR